MSAPKILATGRCLPHRIVTNEELSRQVDTNDEWVFSRTGIHQRHFCDGESGLDLALGSARQALERAGLKAGGHRGVPGGHLHPRLCQPLHGLPGAEGAGAAGGHPLL